MAGAPSAAVASPDRPPRWDELPDEILLQILGYLEPYHITRLQLVSRRLRRFCLDDELWKRFCFEDSPWYQALKDRRMLQTPSHDAGGSDGSGAAADGDPDGDADGDADGAGPLRRLGPQRRRWLALRDMANWDPVYPGERVSWYDEYMQRNGPAHVNWLQTPRMHDRGLEATIEARGMALYSPYDGDDGLGTMLAVSPLDDGSVCLWDVKGTRGRQGGIVARSKPDVLFVDGPGGHKARRSKQVNGGIVESVSVDNSGHRAFFAVQSHLIEVDLKRLEAVSRESFEWSITTLSAVHEGVPLTVGTSLGIHLHDFRARARPAHDVVERLDGPLGSETDVLKAIFDPKPLPPYAPLSQPTPISILHLPRPGAPEQASNDMYVSGRFSNILHYDRRKFPAIVGSIYSGALIKSLTCLPFPLSTVDAELRRRGELSAERAAQTKTAVSGQTLIAGGGYNNKGSLEMYGLSAAGEAAAHGMLHKSAMKNRQTAASATILSVMNHGAKIVFSDGAGLLKWFERDGTTECRRVRIGHCDAEKPTSSLFAPAPAPDDLARKIASTATRGDPARPNKEDDVLFWTGERLGMVSFTAGPLFDAEARGGEAAAEGAAEEAAADEERRRAYAEGLRSVLERQADELRLMGSLGSG